MFYLKENKKSDYVIKMSKRVSDIMSKRVIVIKSDSTILSAIRMLKKKNITGAPVVNEEGKLVGVFSESDVLKIMESQSVMEPFFELLEDNPDNVKEAINVIKEKKVSDVMSKNPVIVIPKTSVSHAASLMWERNFNRLPVVSGKDERIVVGMLTRGDILKAF